MYNRGVAGGLEKSYGDNDTSLKNGEQGHAKRFASKSR